MKRFCLWLGFALLSCSSCWADDAASARVFAAASLTNAMTDLAAAWQKNGHPQPTLNPGSSGTLAKQIEAGAPADLFASADLKWMDYLDMKGLVDHASRRNLLSTTLVLIEPLDQSLKVQMTKDFDIAHAFNGKLCTGEVSSVPAGIYAKQALQSLGWWDSLQDRVVGSDDVRSALSFVERGECSLGIVYATDAKISSKVKVLAEFPADTHTPIIYPFGLIKNARSDSVAFLNYLESAPAAVVFRQYGFTVTAP